MGLSGAPFWRLLLTHHLASTDDIVDVAPSADAQYLICTLVDVTC